jgi:hypothetical protein
LHLCNSFSGTITIALKIEKYNQLSSGCPLVFSLFMPPKEAKVYIGEIRGISIVG